MELVYLWVEDYKNIHKQGFNFSSRFDCKFKDEYSGDGKLKDNCELIICDKEKNECEDNDYIKDFFGDNINVTAIVGKNGSGKSSVLKMTLFLLFCKNYKKEDSYPIGTLVYSLRQFANKEMFLIVKTEGKLKKISFSNFIKHLQKIEFGDENTTRIMTGSTPRKEGKEILKDISEIAQEEVKFFTFYLNYMIDTLSDGWHDNWVNQIYHKQDNYNTPLLIQPDKHDINTSNDIIDLFKIDFINKQRLLLFYKDIKENKKITSFFYPNYLKIGNLKTQFLFNATTPNSIDLDYMEKITNKLTMLLFKYQKDIDITKGDNSILHPLLKNIDDTKNFKYMNLLYLVFKILTIDKDIFNDEPYKAIEEQVIESLKNSEIPDETTLESFDYANLVKDDIDKDDYRAKKVRISIEFHKNEIYNNKKFKLLMDAEKVLINDLNSILEYLPIWTDIVFYEDDKSFDSLSSGEKSIFRMLIDIIYQIEKIKVHYSSINIMLDETELGLHPQWQKEYLNNILKTIALYVDSRFNVNLLFTTHSPFLLSDIPKQNIIFLDTYKKEDEEVKNKKQEDGNCKVLEHNGVMNKKQTFGANIHTLLSDSFFMDDGLMGEFAKNKIQEVMDYLNDEKKIEEISTKEEQIKQVIESIGEPFLKQKLLDMYYIKYKDESLKKVRKKELLAEQRRIEEELKRYD